MFVTVLKLKLWTYTWLWILVCESQQKPCFKRVVQWLIMETHGSSAETMLFSLSQALIQALIF